MRSGTALAVGLALGVALWLATDNVVFVSVGLVFAIAFGWLGGSSKDDEAEDEDDDSDRS